MSQDDFVTKDLDSVKINLAAPSRKLADQFEFLELIDSGGMGVIYKARNITINQIVAIKMIQAGSLEDRHVQRFKQEARALSNLNHYNIVQVKDFGFTENEQPYMVLEFVDGETLSQYIKNRQPISLDKFKSIFTQVIEALTHAHERGVLHRDLKPSNIMIKTATDGAPLVKIVDFGIAKMLTAELNSAFTQTGEAIGSPAYMSPEQISGSQQDARTDIYSLGCVMFEALTGAPPFQAENSVDLAFRQMNADIPDVRATANQKVTESLAAVVTKCLQKDPNQRYQSMALLGTALSDAELAERPVDYNPLLKRSVIYASAVLMIFIAGSMTYLMSERSAQSEKKELDEQKQRVAFDLDVHNSVTYSSPNDFVQRFIRDHRDNEDMSIMDACNDDALIEFTKGNFATKRINLGNSDVKGPGLAYVIRLPKLERLEMQRSSLTDRGLLEISKMKGLKHLSIDADKVTAVGFGYLRDLPQLKLLSARDVNADDKGLTNICKILSLESLNFDGNPNVTAAGYSHLPELKKLELFSIKEIRVTDRLIDSLLQMKSLKRVYFDSTDITDNQLKLLSKSKTLTEVHLENSSNISAAGLKYILAMPQLLSVDLKRNKWVKDADLKLFQKLHQKFHLNLEGTDVTDFGMKILAQTNVRSIEIPKTPITVAGLFALAKAKNLEQINVGVGTLISLEDVEKFKQLRPDVHVDKSRSGSLF